MARRMTTPPPALETDPTLRRALTRYRRVATALLALCRRHGTPLVINDHLDLCMHLDADGVHVGGTDIAVDHARRLLGADKIVGTSCYGELALARGIAIHELAPQRSSLEARFLEVMGDEEGEGA